MGVFRDSFHFDKPEGQRFEVALQLLSDGRSIIFEGMAIRMSSGELAVDIPSSWDIESITTESAQIDLSNATRVLESLRSASVQMNDMIGTRQVRYKLIHDYHNGAIDVCELNKNEIEWCIGFKDHGQTP